MSGEVERCKSGQSRRWEVGSGSKSEVGSRRWEVAHAEDVAGNAEDVAGAC